MEKAKFQDNFEIIPNIRSFIRLNSILSPGIKREKEREKENKRPNERMDNRQEIQQVLRSHSQRGISLIQVTAIACFSVLVAQQSA